MSDLFAATRPIQVSGTRIRQAKTAQGKTAQGKTTQAVARDADHCCRVCGVWAGFGFKNPIGASEPYRWGCTPHRDQVEAMGA